MQYFLICLSFVGWWILVALTLGLAAIWVVSYYNLTLMNFYQDIKEKPLDKNDD